MPARNKLQQCRIADGLQNGIGKCIFKVSIHEKSPGPTRTRRNTSLIDAIESLNSEPLEKSRSGNSSKLQGDWAVNLEKELVLSTLYILCRRCVYRALIYHLDSKETVKKKITHRSLCLTPSTAPIFEVRLNQKNLQNLPRRNTKKGTGTKRRPVSWV